MHIKVNLVFSDYEFLPHTIKFFNEETRGYIELKYDYYDFEESNNATDEELPRMSLEDQQDLDWYNQEQAETKRIAAFTSEEGFKEEANELDWIHQLVLILEKASNAYPEIFNPISSNKLALSLEFLDSKITENKITLTQIVTDLGKFGFKNIETLKLIGKNLTTKHSFNEFELESSVKINRLEIKNINFIKINIKGYASHIKILGSKVSLFAWRSNPKCFDLEHDVSNLIILDSEIDIFKIKVHTIMQANFNKIKIIGTRIGKLFHIVGIKINFISHKSGLILEGSTFSSESNIFIENSNLDYLGFIFSKISKLHITNCSINKSFLNKTSFEDCEFIGLQGKGFLDLLQKNSEPNFSELKEYYRYFKYSHDQIGNKTEANKFFAKEMEYYRKSLEWKDWDKKMISFVQECSNGYGNSWIYPLGWIFAISGVKTYLNGFTVHIESCGVFIKEFCIFSEKLILNINLIDDFKEISNPVEFIYRLLLAFFMYQFLVALRRISQR